MNLRDFHRLSLARLRVCVRCLELIDSQFHTLNCLSGTPTVPHRGSSADADHLKLLLTVKPLTHFTWLSAQCVFSSKHHTAPSCERSERWSCKYYNVKKGNIERPGGLVSQGTYTTAVHEMWWVWPYKKRPQTLCKKLTKTNKHGTSQS